MLLFTALLQDMSHDVTGRTACVHTLTTLAHRIYLMTAEMITTAQFRQTNAAAGKDSAKNIFVTCDLVWCLFSFLSNTRKTQ